MDPVSRRLTAAAMGITFALSRDEELERTRLDLERARMTAEDLRNGGGPDTSFMHQQYGKHKLIRDECHREYKYRLHPTGCSLTVRKRIKTSKDACDALQYERDIALHYLAREFRKNPYTLGYSDMKWAFNELEMTSEDVEELAKDNRGYVALGLDADEEDETSEEQT